MQVIFEANTQNEIKAQIVEAGLGTSDITRFALPWPIQQAPQHMPEYIRNNRIRAIKKVKDELGLHLAEAKNLVDYVLCCFDM